MIKLNSRNLIVLLLLKDYTIGIIWVKIVEGENQEGGMRGEREENAPLTSKLFHGK